MAHGPNLADRLLLSAPQAEDSFYTYTFFKIEEDLKAIWSSDSSAHKSACLGRSRRLQCV